jgi:hypothetical protein
MENPTLLSREEHVSTELISLQPSGGLGNALMLPSSTKLHPPDWVKEIHSEFRFASAAVQDFGILPKQIGR